VAAHPGGVHPEVAHVLPDDAPVIAVFGGNDVDDPRRAAARAFGAEANRSGAVLLTGGVGKDPRTVKDAAILAAIESAGVDSPAEWIGVQRRRDPATPVVKGPRSIVVTPGWDHRRNVVGACLCDAAIAVDGGSGTASEVLFALFLRRPVVVVGADPGADPAGAVRALRDRAVQIIPWPRDPTDPIDVGIAAAYRWADDPDAYPQYRPLPGDAAAAAHIIGELIGRIPAVAVRPDFDALVDERSWNALVADALSRAGRPARAGGQAPGGSR
jgi:hypothetical protein